jgi:hypothetical protein
MVKVDGESFGVRRTFTQKKYHKPCTVEGLQAVRAVVRARPQTLAHVAGDGTEGDCWWLSGEKEFASVRKVRKKFLGFEKKCYLVSRPLSSKINI